MLVVGKTLVGTSVETLLAVELIRGCIPYIAQGINIEGVLVVALLNHDGAGVGG